MDLFSLTGCQKEQRGPSRVPPSVNWEGREVNLLGCPAGLKLSLGPHGAAGCEDADDVVFGEKRKNGPWLLAVASVFLTDR